MDHVCGGSQERERKIGGGYKVLHRGISCGVRCSERVGDCYVIGYLGFYRFL